LRGVTENTMLGLLLLSVLEIVLYMSKCMVFIRIPLSANSVKLKIIPNQLTIINMLTKHVENNT
jgi:hypothetical protein